MARIRTFIAVDIGETVCARCEAMQETLGRSGADVKWVERENLHLTLLFLGEVDEREIHDVCRAVKDTCAGIARFHAAIQGVGCFPNPRRPKVIWAGVGEGKEEMVALHDSLEAPLLELGCYRREERKYTPHLTLGRVRGEDSTDRLAQALARQAEWKAGECEVGRVQVMASELRPEGPVYSVLSTAKLG